MSRRDDSMLRELAARAGASPHAPWLFYRRGLDWHWRSWSRVADQVARGAAELRRRLAEPGRKFDARVAFDSGQDPDGIAAGLAIRAAGAVAVPVAGGRAAEDPGPAVWARVDGTSEPPGHPAEVVVLPAALSPLARTPPQPLELDPAAAPGPLELPGAGELPPGGAMAAARDLASKLPAFRGRPILCVTPDADLPATRALQAWTLHSGAAWVLEPLADAFVPTVLWARPTVVCARAGEVARLAEGLDERRRRRHHRLRALVLLGGGDLPPAVAGVFRDLGTSLVALPPEAVQSGAGD